MMSNIVWGERPKVIAHRGYWQADGSAQNSIRSIVKSDSIGCYASEFDVWMTVDSVLLVYHDAIVNGYRIEESAAKVIQDQKLTNGENVPTLEEYLKTASALDSRIVCELKPHDSREVELKAVRKIVEMVDTFGLSDRTDYITFSSDAFKTFIRVAPKCCGVYYLEGDYIPAQIKYLGGTGIDYNLYRVKKNPKMIEEAHELGLLVNVWTVDSEEDMVWCIDNNVDFITTNRPETLQNLIK